MNKPTLVGGPALPVIRVAKKCPDPPKGCGARYEGNALTPLKPGEEFRVHPCDICIAKWEIEQAEFKKRTGQEPPSSATLSDTPTPRLAGDSW